MQNSMASPWGSTGFAASSSNNARTAALSWGGSATPFSAKNTTFGAATYGNNNNNNTNPNPIPFNNNNNNMGSDNAAAFGRAATATGNPFSVQQPSFSLAPPGNQNHQSSSTGAQSPFSLGSHQRNEWNQSSWQATNGFAQPKPEAAKTEENTLTFSGPSLASAATNRTASHPAVPIQKTTDTSPFLQANNPFAQSTGSSSGFSLSTASDVVVKTDPLKPPSNLSADEVIAEPLAKLTKASQLIAALEPGSSCKETVCRQIETLLTESFHSFRLANDQSSYAEGAPSAVALYNMACVLSLALELQMSLSRKDSVQAMVNSFGEITVASLQRDGFFVAPQLPPQQQPQGEGSSIGAGAAATTLLDAVNRRAIACDRCLRAAVAVGWTDVKHLRADRDLRVYLASMDTSWLPPPPSS